MKVLITGGAGMVGSHCAQYYAEKDCEVIVLDNLMRSKLFGFDRKSVEYNWNHLEGIKNVVRVKGDVRNDDNLTKAIGDGVDVCIHTAGQPGVRFSYENPKEDFAINAYGTLNVLEHLRGKCDGAVFIYTSTNKVYGENVDKYEFIEDKTRYRFKDVAGVSESLPIDLTGHTPYGASKYVGDIYAQEYAHMYGMKTGVFRMSCIYGTRQFGFEDQGWISHFAISTLLKRPIVLYGDGKQVRDILYVDDLCNAFSRFAEKKSVKSGVYNIGGGPENTISLNELLGLLEDKIGKKPEYTHDDWRPSDQRVYVSDINKVCKELSWKPQVGPQEGIGRLIDWTRENIALFQ
ncbi:MAG: NAD-dependent epimerase/dehydratase family protein [Candidatus Altiarchaeota archaeon]